MNVEKKIRERIEEAIDNNIVGDGGGMLYNIDKATTAILKIFEEMIPKEKKNCEFCEKWDNRKDTCREANEMATKWGLFCGAVCGDYKPIKSCKCNQCIQDLKQKLGVRG